MDRYLFIRRNKGFTLVELLIVISIIGIIAVIFLLMTWNKSVRAGNDVQRKVDLLQLKQAFEEYYNDHGKYPPITMLDSCGGSGLSPFLTKIPCDPVTNAPYYYKSDSDTDLTKGNRLCGHLEDYSDPDIARAGCGATSGCGWGEEWNYCVSAGSTISPSTGFNPDATPTPTPSQLNGPNACRPGIQVGGTIYWPGVCNNVGNPSAFGCPASFVEADCQGKCASIEYWCTQ